ncbi:MAG: tRNA uridine-5-carboxymethylaminomethyl(34) synthesis GTPase MnmE [Bradymonadales bacterium]|nr:tRNA uridine-5-carboxymethylaminomethyl(34) synthesis GTPase MnmE [Bradymonadales bacterium]
MAFDTIAAIATPTGTGGIGIIRISGPEALPITRRLARRLPLSPPSHHMLLVPLHSPQDGSYLDQALVVAMLQPHSYTGEDVVELHCHGGPVHLSSVLRAVLAAGARPAEPGEFTRRAFLNGRLDLLQAEAIEELIEARSERACQLARDHLEGHLSATVQEIREHLLEALTLVEASLDFSLEEHVYAVDRDALASALTRARQEIDAVLSTYDQGKRLTEGIRCAIAGRPNSGKSTLFNRLLQVERAITSPTPGTTRDYLDAQLLLDGQLYWLVDTAGIGDTQDSIEAEGIRRSRQILAGADLVFLVADSSRPWGSADRDLLEQIATVGVFVWNKVDLPSRSVPPPLPEHWCGPLCLSLIQPDSLAPLQAALIEATGKGGLLPSTESVAICRERHRDALQRASANLGQATISTSEGKGEELIACDLRLALEAIGELSGLVTPDEVLGRIFSRFCIGK